MLCRQWWTIGFNNRILSVVAYISSSLLQNIFCNKELDRLVKTYVLIQVNRVILRARVAYILTPKCCCINTYEQDVLCEKRGFHNGDYLRLRSQNALRRSKLAQVVRRLASIYEVPCLNSVRNTDYPEGFYAFPQFLHEYGGNYCKLSHDCFLPHTL
jgi:hypothetical protein